jgi:hypothetical protein
MLYYNFIPYLNNEGPRFYHNWSWQRSEFLNEGDFNTLDFKPQGELKRMRTPEFT